MKSIALALLLALPAHAQFAEGNWKTDRSRKSIDLNELVRGGPPKDGIRSIDNPRFLPSNVIDWLAPKELVIAVHVDGKARAYPLQILMWHELVNDRAGENPILVSYCPLCNSAIVFDRRVAGATLEFGVSGMLRNSDMVMYDRQTDSLWQQITGEGIVGTHTGSTLRIIPSQMIPFDQFKESYPGGVVLTRETGFQRDYGRNPYRAYEFGNGPIMPVRSSRTTSLRPMEKLVVLKDGKGYRAYPVSQLARRGVIEDKVDGRPLVLFYTPDGLSPVDAPTMAQSRSVGSIGVFSAENASGSIRFRREKGRIEDRETGSGWNVTGKAYDGALKGTSLNPVEHGVYFAFAWLAFQPDTLVVGEPPASPRLQE
ncbi:MAG: DUF3179 domain-containing protein [Acidobacteria bacterium]|nr:DUF3179 domain-containing protein [Acidobacteriota bacterium]